MERNRTIDGAISKRRRPRINRVLLVHEPAALADLRPATVNQCFYEHSLAGTASLQPRLTEPPQPPTRGRPSLVSARTSTTLPLWLPLPPPIRTHSRTATHLLRVYLRNSLFSRTIGIFSSSIRCTASTRTEPLGVSRGEKKGNSRSPRKRGCLDNLLSLRINIRFAVH